MPPSPALEHAILVLVGGGKSSGDPRDWGFALCPRAYATWRSSWAEEDIAAVKAWSGLFSYEGESEAEAIISVTPLGKIVSFMDVKVASVRSGLTRQFGSDGWSEFLLPSLPLDLLSEWLIEKMLNQSSLNEQGFLRSHAGLDGSGKTARGL